MTLEHGCPPRQESRSKRRQSSLCLEPGHTECKHSRAIFECSFVAIGSRRDLSDGAKRLHAVHVSMHRTGARWTQAEIGERLGWNRQKVWRFTVELVTAGLLTVKRVGLGRPNEYTLLPTDGVSQEDLDGNAPRFKAKPAGHQEVRPVRAPSWTAPALKESSKNMSTTGVPETYALTREYGMAVVDGRLRYVGPTAP